MNKKEMIKLVAIEASITIGDAGRALDAVLGTIADSLAGHNEVTLVGFGTFTTLNSKARVGRNPSTGASINIPAKTRCKFKPGRALKAKVNGEV